MASLCTTFFHDILDYPTVDYIKFPKLVSIFGDPDKGIKITIDNCREICGDSLVLYSWNTISPVISTWVLPVLSLTTQAPFSSNKTRSAIFELARWLGSPISSLACILININATRRCASLLGKLRPNIRVGGEAEFRDLRDSLYLLSIMNQYAVSREIPQSESWEKLVRVVVFSGSLRLQTGKLLIAKRRKLVRNARRYRRRGVIPLFISLVWYMFALGISINGGKKHLYSNEKSSLCHPSGRVRHNKIGP